MNVFEAVKQNVTTRQAAELYGISVSRNGMAPEQKYRQEEMHCYKVLCEYFHLLQKWEQHYAPQTPEDDLHPLFVEALQRKSYTEYLLDSFLDGSPEERRELVAQQGKEVMKLEQRIAEWTAAGTLHRGTGQKQPGTDRER